MSEATVTNAKTSRSKKKKRTPPKNPVLRVLAKIFEKLMKLLATILLIAVVTASIAGCVLLLFIAKNMKETDNIPDLKKISAVSTSSIYIKDFEKSKGENEVFIHSQDLDGVKSIWVPFEEIPNYMKYAVVAIEDHRFYTHKGVDWKRTIGATANYFLKIREGEFGGSTITQQLIKNVDGDDSLDVSRKIREIFKATKLESQAYSKDVILEAYLNILPLASGVDGVGAAAQYFFGKDVSELTLAECTVIAGMTQNPAKYSPYGRPENVRDRQKMVLRRMYELKYISKEEYVQALNEEMHYKNGMKHVDLQDYYVDYLINDVANALIEDAEGRGEYLDKKLAVIQVYTGGLKIYSAENPAVQKQVDDIMLNTKFYPKHYNSKITGTPSAGITVLDYTGRVVAVSGGPGAKEGNRVANLATDGFRSPGSAMKPISAYAPAINSNVVTYSTIVQDKPLTTIDGKGWPKNYGGGRYGARTVVDAVKLSINTIAVQVGNMYGVNRSFDFLVDKLHMTSLIDSKDYYNAKTNKYETKSDRNASMFLGGLTEGVNTLEMAAAYQMFGNGGYYNRPYSFYKVEKDNELFIDRTPTPQKAIDEDSAYIMNKMLQEVCKSGTARGLTVGNHTIFGKTGTSSEDKDFYFVGGSGHYVAAVWYGYKSSHVKMSGNHSGKAKEIWQTTMLKLHNGLNAVEFNKTGGVSVRLYCASSGQIATKGCSNRLTGYYKPNFVPGLCKQHGGGGAYDDKPATGTTTTASKEATTTTTKDGGETEPTTTTTTPVATTTTTTTTEPEPEETDDTVGRDD